MKPCAHSLIKPRKLKVGEERRDLDKINFKLQSALLRATVLAVFHFVEAYLNGLAFDYYILKEKDVSEETKTLLFDWNPKTKSVTPR